MALPTAEQRRELPLTVAFLAASALVALTAGFALGLWLLFHASLGVPLASERWTALVQLHGHAQLAGFAGLLIMGIGYRVVPRFRGAPAPAAALVALSLVLMVSGLALRTALVWPELPARAVLLFASGTLELAGAVVYAGLVVGLLSSGENAHRPDELLIGAGAMWLPIGAAWGLVSFIPAMAGTPAADLAADASGVAALLFGFVGAHVLGVSLRVAPAFIAAPASSDRLVVAGALGWAAGVFLLTLGIGLGALVLLASGIALVYAIGVFRRRPAVREIPAPARVTRLAFRCSYAWLLVGLGLLVAGSVATPAALSGLTTAARHALALGFLMSIVFGVGSRLVPALTGGNALSLGAVRAALLLTNGAALLRVAFEIGGPTTTLASGALAVSGVLAYAAVLVFAGAAARSVRSALT